MADPGAAQFAASEGSVRGSDNTAGLRQPAPAPIIGVPKRGRGLARRGVNEAFAAWGGGALHQPSGPHSATIEGSRGAVNEALAFSPLNQKRARLRGRPFFPTAPRVGGQPAKQHECQTTSRTGFSNDPPSGSGHQLGRRELHKPARLVDSGPAHPALSRKIPQLRKCQERKLIRNQTFQLKRFWHACNLLRLSECEIARIGHVIQTNAQPKLFNSGGYGRSRGAGSRPTLAYRRPWFRARVRVRGASPRGLEYTEHVDPDAHSLTRKTASRRPPLVMGYRLLIGEIDQLGKRRGADFSLATVLALT